MNALAIILYVLTLSVNSFAKDLQNVLLVGDSHAYGRYGTVLDSYFRTRAEQVTSFASCGSSPSTWTKGSSKFAETNCGFWKKSAADKEIRVKSHKLPSFKDEVEKNKPDVVVISMGTNILSSKQNIERELTAMSTMLTEVQKAQSQCVWIGPPDLTKNPFKENLVHGIERLKATAEKFGCTFVDSSKVTRFPSGKNDGIHYGPKDSTAWGQAVVKNLNDIVKVNEVPASTHGKPPTSKSGTR